MVAEIIPEFSILVDQLTLARSTRIQIEKSNQRILGVVGNWNEATNDETFNPEAVNDEKFTNEQIKVA